MIIASVIIGILTIIFVRIFGIKNTLFINILLFIACASYNWYDSHTIIIDGQVHTIQTRKAAGTESENLIIGFVSIPFIASIVILGILLLVKNTNSEPRSAAPQPERPRIKAKRTTIWRKCPSCGGRVEDGFSSCPHCGNTNLPTETFDSPEQPAMKTCKRCKSEVTTDWTACPNCGSEDFEELP